MKGYELTTKREQFLSLASGATYNGWRIRYRREGSRPWRSFLLSVEGDGEPTAAMIEQAVRAHESGSAAR